LKEEMNLAFHGVGMQASGGARVKEARLTSWKNRPCSGVRRQQHLWMPWRWPFRRHIIHGP